MQQLMRILLNQSYLFIFIFSVFDYINVTAQIVDTLLPKVVIKKEVPKVIFPDSIFQFRTKHPLPKRAGLYSALLPGLGQVYNKQYWKTGLVIVGTGVITYFMVENHTNYKRFQKAYIDRLNNPNNKTDFPNRTAEDLKSIRDSYRQLKEYTVISAVVGYLVTILDAYTSSHLKSFDMGKDISYHFGSPSVTPINQPLVISCAIHF
jgi:hypothetical protein